MARITARAHARVGLLGNPSDLYGGRGLGLAVSELSAEVALDDASRTRLESELFRAGWHVFSGELAARGIDADSRPFALSFSSTIPFQAGLSGSSALLIAALRAWSEWFGLALSRSRLAELAWRTENEQLGIRAGPLDRLVQAHEGLLAMDFRSPWAEASIERLDPALLPPLFLAWHGEPGQSSGDVHAPVYARWLAGDREVRDVTERLAANSDAGRDALLARDVDGFLACIDRNLELRARLFDIAPADRALVELGRSLGAAAKFPGSGGAVLFACRDARQLAEVERACRERGHSTLRPSVARPQLRVRALFLAAGFATRLHPLTLHKAKPLLEIGGVPLLTRILRQVERMGCVQDAVLVSNARFHADFVAWSRGVDSRIPLAIVDDGALSNETRLGAIADLSLALESAPQRDDVDAHLVLACDNLFEFELAELATRFAARGTSQLIVREVPVPVPPSKYSEVCLEGDRIVRFREKPADPQSNLSAIAAYLLPRDLPALVQRYLAEGGNPDAPGHFLAWLAGRIPLEASRLEGAWLDIGSPDDFARAQRDWSC